MVIASMDEIEAARQVVLNNNAPKPPYLLTDDQGDIWTRLFMTLEPGWITESQFDLAIAYCRHADAANKYSSILSNLHTFIVPDGQPELTVIKEMDRVSKMIEREVRSLSSIATRLRITNQAIRTADVKKPSTKPAPWEVTDDLLTEESEDGDSEG